MVNQRVIKVVRTVAPREGRVSRNDKGARQLEQKLVAPREGRVSRNNEGTSVLPYEPCRAPRGACE